LFFESTTTCGKVEIRHKKVFQKLNLFYGRNCYKRPFRRWLLSIPHSFRSPYYTSKPNLLEKISINQNQMLSIKALAFIFVFGLCTAQQQGILYIERRATGIQKSEIHQKHP
jgi:hypothetical protein